MDFSQLNPARVALGALGSVLMILSVLFLPWFDLTGNETRDEPDDWVCGVGDSSCTAFETFPILRWLLLLSTISPLVLAWILIRGHKLSWTPGEMTMVVGFTAFVLIAYNGIIDRPGSTFGVGLEYGYWVALLAAALIAATGYTRSLESGGAQKRKAPGTV